MRTAGTRIISFITQKTDWKLLAFLLLFLNVKLVVKLAAIVLIFLLQRGARLGLKDSKPGPKMFYLSMMAIALLNAFLYGDIFQSSYGVALAFGLSLWMLCFLALHQVKTFVEKNDSETLHHTLLIFFLINAAVSFATLFSIIIETAAINPYRYQGNYQKYFINTGDYIKGVTFDTSTTNAAINAFGIIFFLHKRNSFMVLLCMATLLLTASNVMNLLLFGVLAFVFAFRSVRDQKSLIVACLLMTAVFLSKISPQNVQYVNESMDKVMGKRSKQQTLREIPLMERPDSLLNDDQVKEKRARLYLDSINRLLLAPQPTAAVLATPVAVVEKPELPKDDIHSATFQSRDDTTDTRKELISIVTKTEAVAKLIAMQQTAAFFKEHPFKIITGAGMANFSSKLAFRATGLSTAGSYPRSYLYVHQDFEKNHLALYSHFFSRKAGMHSVVNSPNSALGQVWSEYGLAGLACFLIFYTGYFIRNGRKLTYGIPLLMLFVGLMFVDYWFEQLSVVVLFELMMLLNIKDNS
jgi:hypothetical protein